MYTQQAQQHGTNTVSSKELSYITDSLKNEELLAKMAAQAISDCHTPQLKQKMTQIAQDCLQHTDQLLRTLQQHTQLAH
jgi:hypothetical protein